MRTWDTDGGDCMCADCNRGTDGRYARRRGGTAPALPDDKPSPSDLQRDQR